jgi:hypothetical protein
MPAMQNLIQKIVRSLEFKNLLMTEQDAPVDRPAAIFTLGGWRLRLGMSMHITTSILQQFSSGTIASL